MVTSLLELWQLGAPHYKTPIAWQPQMVSALAMAGAKLKMEGIQDLS